MFFLVWSNSIFILLCISSATSVWGWYFGLGLYPSLQSSMLCGMRLWNTREGSQPSEAWYVVLWFNTVDGKNLCQLCRNSPVAALSCVFTEAWVLSRRPIVWACFIVACLSSTPRTAVTS